MIRSTEILDGGRRLAVRWDDGTASTLPAVWLRDNAQDAQSRHAGNGQRLFTILDVPADIRIAAASTEGGGLALRFAPDGHATRFEADWLRCHAAAPLRRAPGWVRDGLELWDAGLTGHLPTASWDRVASDDRALLDWLDAVRRLGVARLAGVPCESGALVRVVERFGHVRETNYGRWFDVRSEVNPSNLAYTSLGLQVHTDNPYRDPVPGLQLLHCLANSTDGGESVVVDGFAAAHRLRDADEAAFLRLARTPVPFRYASGDAVLESRFPLLGLAADGELVEVRFNNRSLGVPALAEDEIEPWYAAYRRFAALLELPALEVRFRLEPGELFIVDNRRVLHGRTGFSGAGQRHLQGCYADRDGLLSRWASLRSRLVAAPAAA
ncbi:MAG: TauD/TfdA family dioxygenase [Geminicoccaceae bacterium]